MNKDILSSFRPAFVMTALFAVLLGIVYPLAMTGIGQAIFPDQANGSLVFRDGRVIGSTVVGQAFTTDRYFHTRPSAAGSGYDGLASSGSNLGPASQALRDRVRAQVGAMKAAEPDKAIPVDLVTASASGLDPDITPEAAYYQIDRIARIRRIEPGALKRVVAATIEQPFLGFIGEPHVNVLELNRRLDGLGVKPAR